MKIDDADREARRLGDVGEGEFGIALAGKHIDGGFNQLVAADFLRGFA